MQAAQVFLPFLAVRVLLKERENCDPIVLMAISLLE